MKLDDFYPLILVDVLGCPAPLLDQALVLAAQEFCRETFAWTEAQDPVQLVDGINDYELDVPAQATALAVRDVWFNGRRLHPATLGDLQRAMPNWATTQGNEPAYYNAATERGSIRVFPMPAGVVGQSLTIRTAFSPTLTATTLPDFLGSYHAEILASGAKARLMMMAGDKPWANAQLGLYHRKLFDDGIANAKIAEIHDRVPGPLYVAPRRFGF